VILGFFWCCLFLTNEEGFMGGFWSGLGKTTFLNVGWRNENFDV